MRSSIYYVVYSKLVKISSDTQFLKFYTVALQMIEENMVSASIILPPKLEQNGCNCSHQKYQFCILIYISVQSKKKSGQVGPHISAECTGDAVRNLEVNSFLSSKRITRLFILIVIDMRNSIYYVVYSKLLKITSDTQFLKFYTCALQMI